MYHIFLNSCVDKHLGSFHILIIEISAAMNIGVHASFGTVLLLGYMARSGISESYGSFCLFVCLFVTFKGT